MSANNLVTSGYIAMLRQAAVEGTPINESKLRRRVSSLGMLVAPSPRKSGKDSGAPSSVATTATTPGDYVSCPSTPASAGGSSCSMSLEAITMNPTLSCELSLNRFRDIGLVRRQAHCPQDVLLCWKMCSLMGLDDVPDIFVVMLFRSTKLLHRCGYHTQDIVTMASYAVVYAVDVLAQHLGTMDWKEAANMFGLQLYLAHAYLMDEHCPLKEWHKHIFSQYCSLAVLSSATMQLMRSRGFKLCLPATGLQHIHRELLLAVHNYRWNPSILDAGEEK
jgi:hypothetical protein